MNKNEKIKKIKIKQIERKIKMRENKKIKRKERGRWNHGNMEGWVRKGKSKREKRENKKYTYWIFFEKYISAVVL